MRNVTASLAKLVDLRDRQREIHNRTVTLSSLIGSTVRAAEVALWRAESEPLNAEAAEHVRRALDELHAAAAKLTTKLPITHIEDLKLIMNEETP